MDTIKKTATVISSIVVLAISGTIGAWCISWSYYLASEVVIWPEIF